MDVIKYGGFKKEVTVDYNIKQEIWDSKLSNKIILALIVKEFVSDENVFNVLVPANAEIIMNNIVGS